MPNIIRNRTNPNLVVPNLIIRQPLPSGTEIVKQKQLDELESNSISPIRHDITRLENLIDGLTNILTEPGGVMDRVGVLEHDSIPLRGLIIPWGGTTIPTGWLECNGEEHLIVNEPELYAVLGTTFGGNGVTTFAVPDLRERFTRGKRYSPVGTTFEASTGAPAGASSISSTSINHRHDVNLSSSGAHKHTDVTAADSNARHNHYLEYNPSDPLTSGGHDHMLSIPAHDHLLGNGGTPITAFLRNSKFNPDILPYTGNETTYDTLNDGGGQWAFFITYPAMKPDFQNWRSTQHAAQNYGITGGQHNHGVQESNATHSHNVTFNTDTGAHAHSGKTEYKDMAHTHILNIGWDAETRPKCMDLIFIIRAQ